MKIATYNVNGVNGRLSVLLRWFDEAAPDIVCLQELKCPNEKFPIKAIQAAGYNAIWHGQQRWNGVAVLARMAAAHCMASQRFKARICVNEVPQACVPPWGFADVLWT